MLEGLAGSWEFELLPNDVYRVKLKIQDLDGGGRGHQAAESTTVQTGIAGLYLLHKQFNLPIELRVASGLNRSGDPGTLARFSELVSTQFKRQIAMHTASAQGSPAPDEVRLLADAEKYLSDNGLLDAAKTVTTLQ